MTSAPSKSSRRALRFVRYTRCRSTVAYASVGIISAGSLSNLCQKRFAE